MQPRIVYLLTVCFGVSSWITINGVFAILPAIIDRVPESWSIAATLGLAVQMANLGPLVYRLYRKRMAERIPATIYGILILGALNMLLLACFWDVKVLYAGAPCSVVLIAGTFGAALCDCTSSVVYWPFVGGMLAPSAVAGLALGENLSGVAASIVSWLGLGPGGSFIALAVVLGISGCAFYALHRPARPAKAGQSTSAEEVFLMAEPSKPLSSRMPCLLVGLMSLYENAVLPTVLPFATARYSLRDYHVASTLPLGSLMVLSLTVLAPTRALVASLSVAASCAVGMIVCVGAGGADIGGATVVTIVCLAKAIVAYCKAASMYNLKVGAGSAKVAQQHLEAAGVTMQACSFAGAVVMFILVHYTALFRK